jgi:hypothetical protein
VSYLYAPPVPPWPQKNRAKKPPRYVLCPHCYKLQYRKGSKTHIDACKREGGKR